MYAEIKIMHITNCKQVLNVCSNTGQWFCQRRWLHHLRLVPHLLCGEYHSPHHYLLFQLSQLQIKHIPMITFLSENRTRYSRTAFRERGKLLLAHLSVTFKYFKTLKIFYSLEITSSLPLSSWSLVKCNSYSQENKYFLGHDYQYFHIHDEYFLKEMSISLKNRKEVFPQPWWARVLLSSLLTTTHGSLRYDILDANMNRM